MYLSEHQHIRISVHQKIFLLGMPGVGKTFWVNKLKDKLKLPAYDLDILVEQKEEKTVVKIFSQHGEAYFRNAETEMLRLFAEKEQFILSCGGGAPCVHNNMRWMNEHGITIWLDAPVETLHERLIKELSTRPLISHLNEADLRTYLLNTFEARKQFYNQAAYHLTSGELTESSFIKILKQYA